MEELRPKIVGNWPYGVVSKEMPYIVVLDGKEYQRTHWPGNYKGVVAQYREMVKLNSRHLLVRKDGTYAIEHVDSFNPDYVFPLHPALHFLVDHPLGRFTAFVLAIFAVKKGAK